MRTEADPMDCEWLRVLLRSTPDHAVILTGPDGVIRSWLGAAEHTLGFSAADVVGQPLAMLFTPEDRERGLDAQEIDVARAQGRSEDDRWHVRKNGSQFWASGTLTAVRNDAGELLGFCKLLRDRTDVRMRMHSLERLVATRESELAAQREALAATAHEMRNPMMPIESALELLTRTESPAMVATAVNILRNQVGLLKTLVDRLVEPQADAVQAPLVRLETINLGAALREIDAGFQMQASLQSKTLMLMLPAADVWIRADPHRLQQMMLNLLGNAFKYTRRGGHIGVSLTIEAGMAVIRIEDDGRGIAAEVLPHIFELFTRERREDGVEGMGIGLAVVQESALLHGGSIDGRSPGPGGGSVFSLRLPLAPD